jgi:peptidoglycan DL-endopeptidase CwlO
LAALLVLGPGLPARANPTASDIEQQIDAMWQKLEPLIEQYDKVHAQLEETQTKVDALRKQIEPLQLQVDLAMARVGASSAQLYEHGPGFGLGALLASGSPDSLVDQLSTIDQMAHQQTELVSGAAALRDQYQVQKKPLDDLVGQLSAQDADLSAKKTTIENQMNQLEALRQQACGAGGCSTGNLQPTICPVEYYGDKGSVAARKACSLIGKPYIWGAAGPTGYDCSGLTLTAWAAVGVTLGHYTGWQWSETRSITRAQLRPGDLVFFYSVTQHVGIYVGGGWVVHAPHAGDRVRMARLESMPVAGYRRPG